MNQSPSSTPLTPKRSANPGDGGENRHIPPRPNVIGSPSRRISAVNPSYGASGARISMDPFLSVIASGDCTVVDSCFSCEDPRSLRRHLSSKLAPSRELQESFLRCFEAHFNLDKEINSLLIPIRGPNLPSESLVRVMLGVPCIQSQVINILLEKLPELLADEDAHHQLQATSLPRLIISQLRWLEFVEDPASLTSKLLDVLPLCPAELRNDILSLLPDVARDDQHTDVIEALLALLAQDPVASTAPVLDALAQLCPERELLAAAVAAGMGCLASADAGDLPVVIRFLLQNAAEDNVAQIVQALRKSLAFLSSSTGMDATAMTAAARGGPGQRSLAGNGNDPRPTQKDKGKAVAMGAMAGAEPNWIKAVILDALCSGLVRHRVAGTQFLSDIEAITVPGEIQVVDLWVLLLLQAHRGGGEYGGGPVLASAAWGNGGGGSGGGIRKAAAAVPLSKIAEGVLRRKIIGGHFGSAADVASLLQRAVAAQGGSLREYFGELVRIAGELLAHGGGGGGGASSRGGEEMRAFGGCLYAALFKGFSDDFHRQEVLAALITHTGAHGPESTASLRTLVHLARTHAALLRPFAVFIHNILDYLSGFTDDQLRLVFQTFGALATSGTSDSDDAPPTSPKPSQNRAANMDNEGGHDDGVATANSGNSSSGGREGPQLPPELMIVIRKQLSSGLPQFKRIGVVGAVTLLAQLGSAPSPEERAATSSSGAGAGAARTRIRARLDLAMALLRQTEEACAHCPPGRAFLYDELATMLQGGGGGERVSQDGAGSSVVAAGNVATMRPAGKGAGVAMGAEPFWPDASSASDGMPLHPRLVAHLALMASNEVEGSFITSIEEEEEGESMEADAGGAEAMQAGAAAEGAGHGTGGAVLRGADWFNLDGSEAPVKLALLDVLASDTKDRRDAALWMAPALRLLAEASIREHVGSAEPLEGMDALLGCPLRLVHGSLVTDGGWERLSMSQRVMLVRIVFFAINWMRELVNAFSSQLVADASKPGTSSSSSNGQSGGKDGAAACGNGQTMANGAPPSQGADGGIMWSGAAADYAVKLVKRLKAIRDLEAMLDRLVSMGPCSTSTGDMGAPPAGWELPCLSEMLQDRNVGGGGPASWGGAAGRKPPAAGKGKGKRPAAKASAGGKGRAAKVARQGAVDEGGAQGDRDEPEGAGDGGAKEAEARQGGEGEEGNAEEGEDKDEEEYGAAGKGHALKGKGEAGQHGGPGQPSFVRANRGLFRVLLPRSLVLLQLAPRMAWVAETTGIRPDEQMLLMGYLAEDLLAKLDWVVGQEAHGAVGLGGKPKMAPWLVKGKGAGGGGSSNATALSLRGVSGLRFLDGLRGTFPSLRQLMDAALASLSRVREEEERSGARGCLDEDGGLRAMAEDDADAGDAASQRGHDGAGEMAHGQVAESTQGLEGPGRPGRVSGDALASVFLCLQSCMQKLLQSVRVRSPEGWHVLRSLLASFSENSTPEGAGAGTRYARGPIPGLPARSTPEAALIPASAFSSAFDYLESLAGTGALLEQRTACALVASLDTLLQAATAVLLGPGGTAAESDDRDGATAATVEGLRHRLSVAAGTVLGKEWPAVADGSINAWAAAGAGTQLAMLLRMHVRNAEAPLALLEELVEDGLPRVPSKGGKSAHEGVGGYPALCHATLGTWYNVLHEEAVIQLGLLAVEAKAMAAREKGKRQKWKGGGKKPKGKGKGRRAQAAVVDEEEEVEDEEEEEVEDGDEEWIAEQEELLQRCGVCVDVHANLVLLTKRHEKRGPILASAVKYGGKFVDAFLKGIMPLLQGPRFMRAHEASVLQLLERLQKGTRCVQTLCSEGKTRRLVSVAAKVPAVKRVMERFLFTVKALMHGSELSGAFQIANLKHKDLRGQVVASQVAASDSEEEEGEEEEEEEEEGEEDAEEPEEGGEEDD